MTIDTPADEPNRLSDRTAPEPTDDLDAEHRRAQQSGAVFADGQAGAL